MVAFDGDDERGRVAVADDPAELLLGEEHPGGRPALRMSPFRQRVTLRWVRRTISIIDSIGFVDDSVLARLPSIPRRISVSVSSIPSRNEPAASGQER